MGRLYGPELSLQWLTKEARSAACQSFGQDIDIECAHVACVQHLQSELDLSLFKACQDYNLLWREAVASYYGCSLADAT